MERKGLVLGMLAAALAAGLSTGSGAQDKKDAGAATGPYGLPSFAAVKDKVKPTDEEAKKIEEVYAQGSKNEAESKNRAKENGTDGKTLAGYLSQGRIETINKVIRTSRYLVQQYGREPSADEIAQQMEMPADKVRKVLKIVKEPVSLETPIGDDEESSLGDFVEDRQTLSPADAAMALSLEEQTRKVLATLTPREEQILRLRFGIGEKSDYTLEEVGQRFAVTRERIRQIEAKALRKLRSPNRSRVLESFVGRQ